VKVPLWQGRSTTR